MEKASGVGGKVTGRGERLADDGAVSVSDAAEVKAVDRGTLVDVGGESFAEAGRTRF